MVDLKAPLALVSSQDSDLKGEVCLDWVFLSAFHPYLRRITNDERLRVIFSRPNFRTDRIAVELVNRSREGHTTEHTEVAKFYSGNGEV